MLGTRVGVPLYRREAAGVQPLARLTPVVQFLGQPLVVMVPELAGIPLRELAPVAGDLAAARGGDSPGDRAAADGVLKGAS